MRGLLNDSGSSSEPGVSCGRLCSSETCLVRVVERRRFPFEAFDDGSAWLVEAALASCWLPFCAASFLGPRPRPPREPRERLRVFAPSVPSTPFFAADDLAAAMAPPSVPEDCSGEFCSLVKFHSLLKHSETRIVATLKVARRFDIPMNTSPGSTNARQRNATSTQENAVCILRPTAYRIMRAAE